MPNGKKLCDMTRDELYVVVQQLVKVIDRKKGKHLPDLPPNKRANERHQRMKAIWGRKKSRMLNLLAQCAAHLDPERCGWLIQDIDYELHHDEYLYQSKVAKGLRGPGSAKTKRAKRRAWRKAQRESNAQA